MRDRVRIADVANLESIRTVAENVEIIFNLAGYGRDEPAAMRATLLDGTRNLLQVIQRDRVKKYIWASNLSVYGHPKFDARLNETTPLKPDYALGRITADVENMVQRALPSVTVRVSSIYGPGRDYLAALREGRLRLLNGGNNWQSRIHIDDLVQIFLAALERAEPSTIYLAGDDMPTTVRDFFAELSEALNVPLPLTLETNAARAFGGMTRALNWLAAQPQYQLNENIIGLMTGNYSCMNDKMKQELGVQLQYPTFRDAYEKMLKPGASQPRA